VIGDTIWGDTNGNGVGPAGVDAGPGAGTPDPSDANEPPLAGVTVNLLDSTGAVVATTETDVNGNYLFTGLDPTATFTVEVDPLTLPPGYASAPTGDPEGDFQ